MQIKIRFFDRYPQMLSIENIKKINLKICPTYAYMPNLIAICSLTWPVEYCTDGRQETDIAINKKHLIGLKTNSFADLVLY